MFLDNRGGSSFSLFFFVRRYLLRFFIHLSIVVPVFGEVFINMSLCIELISVFCLATVLVSFFVSYLTVHVLCIQ